MANDLRHDITGLRAIAVISVTVYHLVHVLLPEIDYMRGGFLGVDIFFVISGYLMTMIIMRGLNRDSFNLFDFYKRRAKRICPALLVTVLLFLVLGFLLIGTSDLKRMGTEGFYALLFVSNIYFAQKTDYFGNSALDQIFLHTWSLSVEWQFYMVYPLVLMIVKSRYGTKVIPKLALYCTAIFTVVAILYTIYIPRSSYYVLPARSFELLFGALAYFYPLSFFLERAKQVVAQHSTGFWAKLSALVLKLTPAKVELLGLAIILISLLCIDDRAGWPTLWAVVPLFGTYLCIAANNKQTLLNNVVFQKMGLWSYAIYLAHWPLIVLVSKLGFYVWSLELLLPILLIGVLLHYLVERRRNFGYFCLFCYAAVAALAFYAGQTGVTFRLNHPVTRYAQYGGHTVPFEGTINSIGDTSKPPSFILIGDSFARHYALDLIDRRLHVITVFRDGCYSFANNVSRRSEGYIDSRCSSRYQEALKAIEHFPDLPVVVAQDWPRYKNSLVRREDESLVGETKYENAVASDLATMYSDFTKRTNNHIYLISTPRQTVYDIGSTCMFLHSLDNPLSGFMRNHFTCIRQKELPEVAINKFLEKTTDDYLRLTVIDPNDAICVDGKCEILVGKYIPVFQDGLHYSWAGSVKVVSYILSRIGVAQGEVRTEFEDEQALMP